MTAEQEKLIQDNISLVYYVYTKGFVKYDKGGVYKDDLIGEGMIGLIKAVKAYDSSRTTFSTFAYKCISNEMMHYLKHIFTNPLNRSVSLDTPIKAGKENLKLEDVLETQDECSEDKYTITNMLGIPLTEQERDMIWYSYMGYTQVEIAEIFNTTRQNISRILKSITERYRTGSDIPKRGRPARGKRR